MQVQQLYQTISFPTAFHFSQYKTPHQYLDPKRQMIDRQFQQRKAKQRQGKFKATVKHKPCFMDQHIKHLKANPGPSKYPVELNMLHKKRHKSASLNKINPKASKRTYIDQIQKYSAKRGPGVGKYNLIDPEKKPKIKNDKHGQKYSHLDNVYTLSAQRPGTGYYNPHQSVQKLHLNRTDYKFFKAKHEKQEKKLQRSQSTKLGPSTYTPIAHNTFANIAADKSKKISRWSHGQIQKRKGAIASMKSPSPAQYNLINQWQQSPNKKQPNFGKLKLFSTFSKSARDLNVYN